MDEFHEISIELKKTGHQRVYLLLFNFLQILFNKLQKQVTIIYGITS